MNYKRLTNFYDVLPILPDKPEDSWKQSVKWRAVEETFRETCRRFGYREIRTPMLEETALFTRSVGEATDIVSKEMYSFLDKGEHAVTLKPEGTAPVVRACIENGLFATNPVLKLYYQSQHFRYEHGQKGRYRQHQQLGAEVFGSADPAIDAEVILLAMEFYRQVGITEQTLKVNSLGISESRAIYREKLKEFVRPFLGKMSKEAQNRFEINPLRLLDTKDENEIELLADAPKLLDSVDAESRAHFDTLLSYLDTAGVPYVIDHRLVRGFDYYTRTTFEIVSDNLGAQNALGGGGRYDQLVEQCGGLPLPGIGFGLGTERLLLVLDALGIMPELADERPTAFVVTLGNAAVTRPAAVKILQELRQAGIASDMDYRPGSKFGAQAKRADDLGARYLVILGEDEIAKGTAGLRNQATKEQKEIALTELTQTLLSL